MNEVVSEKLTKKPNASRAPGPKGSFIQGVMSEFNRDTFGFIERCRSDYGDVVRMRFLYLTAHFLYHPADIEYVSVTNAKNFIKSRSLRTPFFRRLVGNGLLTSEGEVWKRQRRLAQPAFHRQRISAYADVMVDYAGRMIADWREGDERDIHRDMMRLTLEIVVKTLFQRGRLRRSRQGWASPVADCEAVCFAGDCEMDSDNRLPTLHSSPFQPGRT